MSKIKINPTRREFLKNTGISAITLTSSGLIANLLAGCATPKIKRTLNPNIPFIEPSYEDKIILSKGLEYQKLISWKDPINKKEFFGINNDFIAFIPLEGKANEGIMWVNNEFPTPYLIHKERKSSKKTKEHIVQEQKAVGGSLIHIKKIKDKWELVKNSNYNRRISGETDIPFVGAVIQGKTSAMGTFANCSGGVTPWNTILSCEENYDDYYGEYEYKDGLRIKIDSSKYGWDRFFDCDPEHYGWVVEVDPLTGKAKKHLTMGRMAHECAKPILAKDGRTVVYTGDDADDEHLYKFISDEKGNLNKGTLYVAHMETGTWRPLTLDNPKLKGKFKDLTDLLVQTRTAAKMLDATPLNRPEDIEILPGSNTVLIACTNNKKRLDAHGYILALDEENKDPLSLKFKAYKWLECGPDAGMSCPDNFAIDKKGNLWVTSDMSEKLIGDFPYKGFGNNGLFYIPTSGEDKGTVYQIASCPKDAEFTGPCFSPDYKTLFLSVQHPGNSSSEESGYTSSWPDGDGKVPRSSVIAISGPLLDRLNT